MCGIIGFTSATKKPELIEKFLKELSHRGPDHQEYIEIDLGNYYLTFHKAYNSRILAVICQC